MSIVKRLARDTRVRALVATATVLGVAGIVVAWKMGLDLTKLKQLWVDGEAFLKANPWSLFLALVFLPGLPFPISALLVLAGLVWGATWWACLLALLALALNMTWTYWVAAYPARGVIEKVLANTSLRIPDLPKQDHVRLILMLRLTPGLPLFIHNYILGFLRTPFRLYLLLSLCLSGPISIGILLTGGALMEGKAGLAITGIGIVVIAVLGTRMLRARLAKKKLALAEAETQPDPAAEI